jgi:hypothetical protein
MIILRLINVCLSLPLLPLRLDQKTCGSHEEKKEALSLAQCIDLTGAASVSRQTLDGMSASQKGAASDAITKTLKTKINKEVKNTLLEVAHREKLALMNCEYLTRKVAPASDMVHPVKPTMDKLMGTIHAIKVGDYVEVAYEYAPGTCSDGGIGFIMEIEQNGEGLSICKVSYVLDSKIETGIDARRTTVTPMPYKDTTSSKRDKRVCVVHSP